MRELTNEEARLLGITPKHHIMDNGERRFRLACSDGSSYIRTEGTAVGEWQNSHYHKCLTEFYIVQVGWIIYTELAKEGTLTLKYVGEGENTIVKPMVHHNIYMSPSTITHVVKYGVSSENIDWFGSPELDKLTKHLKASELVQFLDN